VKLIWTIVAYLVIGSALGWGILSLMKGDPWVLLAGFLVYAITFARAGCLPKKVE
jgi:hypothetical protein